MDPVTIFLAVKLFALLTAVTFAIITMKHIAEWFQQRGHLRNSDVWALTVAERVRNKQFTTVPGVFDGVKEPNRIVQAFYDTKSGKVLAGRRIKAKEADDQTYDRHVKGDGLVVYT
jgi:hypothetical protein